MAYLIGTDEAGYGPNLGPLVVTATLWQTADNDPRRDLYEIAGMAIAARRAASDPRLVIADSKEVYNPRGTLAGLERGIHPLLPLCGCRASTWRELLSHVAPDCLETLDGLPWHAHQDLPLPVDVGPDDIGQLASTVSAEFQRVRVRLLAVRSAVVFPALFNQLVDHNGTKGLALSRLTIDLIARLVRQAGEGTILVVGDKHGGRNKYADLLQESFPEHFIEIHGESARQSVYRWGPESRRVTARFMVKGEQFLPAALASMVSKYLRELSMLAFNTYWQHHVPGLRPTAGYPVDAKRFRTEIEAARDRLRIPWDVLWRNR